MFCCFLFLALTPKQDALKEGSTRKLDTCGVFEDPPLQDLLTFVVDEDSEAPFDQCSFEDIKFSLPVEDFFGIIPSSKLLIMSFDVDVPDEVDTVFLNGVEVGNLDGGNGCWYV